MAGRRDLIEAVSQNVEGVSKKQGEDAVRAVFDAIKEHLENGDSVQIPGFGRFSISERAARTGRNPATGETIQIAASKNVRFKAGKDLKEAVNR